MTAVAMPQLGESVSEGTVVRWLKAVGDNIAVDIELIVPIAMEKTQKFAIREGGRTIGAGRITEITE